MRTSVVVSVVAATFAVALSSTQCTLPAGTGGGSDDDDGDCAAALGLPPPGDACIPVCGNELGVGAPCTKGGGECNQFVASGNAFCTVDNDDTDLAFCTGPCGSDDDCGSDAVCTGDPENPGGPRGCMPAACASEGEGEGEGE
jgi:hypothetical protein